MQTGVCHRYRDVETAGGIKVGERPFGITIDAEGRRAYAANVGPTTSR